ncbi:MULTISPECIES: DUF3526 domain-containing protein [unclassified Chitinophaga]|uniref:DUF3526 domain-containing protein n=1 Tax=unclassified Chitinophaga TaxID=2619133 RepID=UPI0009D48C84|nr:MULTISPECIES: DUF3526 domain-containing protein [unclassified Chitinophaga]OMP78183.1 hypothetical protein BW716_15510 [[Flexibacter] sp. ATCC 35208]WPV66359.1 DUF3526 domain-containing protein [Chitinophaga sp. LS1]
MRYPVYEAYETLLKQRDGYHTKWDKDPKTTIQAFLKHYPQYSNHSWKDSTYLRYYAMLQLGDDEAATTSRAMFKKLEQRQQSANYAARFFPPMHAQLLFTDLAGTGLKRQLQYLDSTAVFHESKRLQFYPQIFDNANANSVNWSRYKPEYFLAPNPVNWLAIFTPFILFITTLGVIASFVFKRNNIQ